MILKKGCAVNLGFSTAGLQQVCISLEAVPSVLTALIDFHFRFHFFFYLFIRRIEKATSLQPTSFTKER